MLSLTTRRLRLRELQPEDLSSDYVNWLNDPAVNAFLETRFVRQDDVSVREFVRTQLADQESILFRMSLADTDRHIGNIKLGPISRHHHSAQLSLFIGETSLHGQGYATEAISAVTDWAFGALGLKRVEAGCYSENLGSLRAFLKAGYTVEGFRRASHVTADGRRCGSFWFARLAEDSTAERG